MKEKFRKNKGYYSLVIITLFLLLIPIVGFAQGTTPEWQKNAVDWIQGGSIMEDWFMKEFLAGYKQIVWGEYKTFVEMAQALGGVFAIMFFALKSYEMMSGDKKLEILPLLRPFVLCLVIINWKSFILLVSFPTDLIAHHAGQKYHAQQVSINAKRYERAELMYHMVNQLYQKSGELEQASDQSKELEKTSYGIFSKGVKNMTNKVYEMKARFEIGITLAITQALETLSLWILRVAVYGVFLLQIVYTGILIMLGPISVAMSIIPMFKDSFSTWIARFISVNLYTGIGFIILFVCGILQDFALKSEIVKLLEIVNKNGDLIDMNKLFYLKSNGIMSFGVVIVSFLLSAVSILTVPSISTWIVSTSGATSAVSTSGRGMSAMTGAVMGMMKGGGKGK